MWKDLISKLTSGKYFATVAIVWTACQGYLRCIDMVMASKMSIEVFLAINTVFWAVVSSVITFYFTKQATGTQK